MKHALLILIIILLVTAVTPAFRSFPASTTSIYFDDSSPDLLLLGNDAYYEIGLRKSNGAIAYLIDKSTGQQVTAGSRYECLWGAVFPAGTPDYVGGCSYNAAWANHFSYSWSASTHTLVLTYTPDPLAGQQVSAQVTVTASDDNAFDLQLQLQNDWGAELDYVLFPSDLVFLEADIQEALLPILPGVVLDAEFFSQDRSYTANYPGYPGLFADYVSVTSAKGQLALYSLYGQGPIRPFVTGFIHDEAYLNDSTYYYHTFGARLEDGGAWVTPQVRFRIGQSCLESLLAYRLDNGLDQFASLQEKFGGRYAQVVQSPLLKADAAQLGLPFLQYPALLDQLPTPGILHPVAFQPDGHDQSYPDFLPPDPDWGTTAEFSAMFQYAQSLGLLVMPYSNPTWWDDESPTLQSLPSPLVITDVAVLDDQGLPSYEFYGSNGGYVMSPYSPYVPQRLAQLVDQMTEQIPSDLLFEDQIGARPWLFDRNPASPYPTAYIEGWLAHTRAYSETLLMTELGFDRLAEMEVGFHGSVLLPERCGYTLDWWGADTWHPYPLAPILTRDKTLFYQHDLAPETFTFDKATLAWNMAFGYMLSYDLVVSEYGGGIDSAWLDVAAAFQQEVFSRYASERLMAYTFLQAQVTQTDFESFNVITNWDAANSYSIGGYTLPPQGAMTRRDDGSVIAGIFTAYNSLPLSGGEHYLIEIRSPNAILIRQPLGAATDITLIPLPGWGVGDLVEAWAYTSEGQVVAQIPFTVTSSGVTLTYQPEWAGQPVAGYRLVKVAAAFLPIVMKLLPH